MNSEPASQSAATAGDSNKSSQKEDPDDDRRYMASLLFLCLIGVVPGALASGLVTALLIASRSTVSAPENGVSPPTNGSTANPLVCNTNDCKLLAQWLRVKVDQTVDPCDDFYQFVCDDYKRLDLLSKTQLDVEQISIYAAYTSNVPATGQTAWQKAMALIKACLTTIDSKRDETKELTGWMTSLGLDLNNLNSSEPFEPVDMVVRFSLDIGVPILLAFSFKDVAMVNNKRLMSLIPTSFDLLLLGDGDTDQHTPVVKNDHLRSLQKYGVDRSRVEGLYLEIRKYETYISSSFTSSLSEHRWDDMLGTIQDLGELTKPIITGVVNKKTFMEANEMASSIRKAFQAAFRSSSWITGSVRKTARRKMMNMRQYIGAVGASLDAAHVEKYYASFPDLPTNQFFKAWRQAKAAAIRQTWADTTILLKNYDKVNAMYDGKYNLLVVLPLMLLPSILFTKGPAAFNYGSLGTILGHEMMHGYDVENSKYDENAKERQWFSREAAEHYANKTFCLRQFHKNVLRRRQEVLNDTVDSENIADLGGTTMAYSAFRSLPASKRETTLPGVTMTANQLFFVGHCTPWCEEQTTKPPRWLSGRSKYAPGRSRCIVPLMNMPEFSDAFHCKRGSYMNPSNKCKFWT
ncbi:neprilysin-2-like isoform X3 [Dermacentor albipictus]|uniref:neprilysin-2-like isoform X3 n=1 Tax=Dermacentor albipictus TaxID=60249 RepID=UPI0038FCAA6F